MVFLFLALFSITIPLVEYQPSLSSREAAVREPAIELDVQRGVWHTCKAGESLRSISLHYYGSVREWRTLQIANSAPLVPEPNTLLWIPGLREEMDALNVWE